MAERSALLKRTHVAALMRLLSTREQSNGTHMDVIPCLPAIPSFTSVVVDYVFLVNELKLTAAQCKVTKSVGKKCKRYDNSKMCFSFSCNSQVGRRCEDGGQQQMENS